MTRSAALELKLPRLVLRCSSALPLCSWPGRRHLSSPGSVTSLIGLVVQVNVPAVSNMVMVPRGRRRRDSVYRAGVASAAPGTGHSVRRRSGRRPRHVALSSAGEEREVPISVSRCSAVVASSVRRRIFVRTLHLGRRRRPLFCTLRCRTLHRSKFWSVDCLATLGSRSSGRSSLVALSQHVLSSRGIPGASESRVCCRMDPSILMRSAVQASVVRCTSRVWSMITRSQSSLDGFFSRPSQITFLLRYSLVYRQATDVAQRANIARCVSCVYKVLHYYDVSCNNYLSTQI